MKEETTVLISDIQAPYHSRRDVKNVIEFIRDFKPDALVNVGDDTDSPEPSYWARGTALEYAGTLQKGMDATREIHRQFREALGDKPYRVARSNHGDRVRRYVAQYAPALSSLRSLDIRELLGYREMDIRYEARTPFSVAPGWLVAHGDEGRISPYAGRTAANLAARWGMSVACGHTHRAGMAPSSIGHSGKVTSTHVGMEVGHLMDMTKAGYLKGGYGNWQSAIGILYRRGNLVQPSLILIQKDGSFNVEGVWYPKPPDTLAPFLSKWNGRLEEQQKKEWLAYDGQKADDQIMRRVAGNE